MIRKSMVNTVAIEGGVKQALSAQVLPACEQRLVSVRGIRTGQQLQACLASRCSDKSRRSTVFTE